jgi:hypothetical protein
MIGGLIGGFIGGTFSVVSQLPFIPGLILVASLYLVWRCFQGDCWFANCRGLRGAPHDPGELDPCQAYKSEGLKSRRHAELRTKISAIVQKNLGMSLKDFVNS